MNVIVHQHVRVDPAVLLVRVLAQQAQVGHTVAIGEEHGLAIVATLNDMLRVTGRIDAWWPWHGLLLGTGVRALRCAKGSDPEHLPIPGPRQSVHGLPLSQ